MKLLKLNQYSGTTISNTKLINSEMIMFIKRDNKTVSIKYFDGYLISDDHNITFEDNIEVEKYFVHVMDKLRAVKLGEKP